MLKLRPLRICSAPAEQIQHRDGGRNLYYEEELIEEVRSGNDIVDVINGYVSLKKKGNSYVACCPFHHEKTPSFHVSRDRQMYHCFGCGVGGNVYTFLMEHENLSFPEAVEVLAERAGVKLPEKGQSKEERRQADIRMRIKDMNRMAAGYFHYLLKTEHGKTAMEYLKNRGLTDETIRQFGLGYSDKYRDDLYRHLLSKGCSDEELKVSGLVRYDEKQGVSDQFWNRVMFPIIDMNDRVIGFGGRVMGDGKPKYLNTRDTPVFDKSRNLYGLNLAKKSRREGIIFCEGYMDVISMHQAGFDNAVASLGTALTVGQVNLVKRYADHVYLAYDSDGPGTKAAERALEIMREFDLPARVISLTPYKDPDEVIQAEGSEGMEERIRRAKSGIMFGIGLLAAKYDQKDPQERTAFQREAAEKLSGIEDPLERGNYVASVAGQYGIDEEILREAVTRYGLAGMGRKAPATGRQPAGRETKEEKQLKTERLLITWMIRENALFEKLKGVLSEEDFYEPVYHEIVSALFAQYREEGRVEPAAILNRFQSREEHEAVSAIMQQEFDMEIAPEEKSKIITELVRSVRLKSVTHQMELAQGDLEKTGKLMLEKSRIGSLKIILG